VFHPEYQQKKKNKQTSKQKQTTNKDEKIVLGDLSQ
jgi:hypothetical protein